MTAETPETIVLPRSGIVLTSYGNMLWRFDNEAGARFELGSDDGRDRWSAEIGEDREVWTVGTRDECIAWLDARVLELRDALCPDYAALVARCERLAAVVKAAEEHSRVAKVAFENLVAGPLWMEQETRLTLDAALSQLLPDDLGDVAPPRAGTERR